MQRPPSSHRDRDCPRRGSRPRTLTQQTKINNGTHLDDAGDATAPTHIAGDDATPNEPQLDADESHERSGNVELNHRKEINRAASFGREGGDVTHDRRRPTGRTPAVGRSRAGSRQGQFGSIQPPDATDRVPGAVLVVEDDEALAEMLSLVLRNEGFVPMWCARGDKALDTYRRGRPDLVLLDLMLPGKDGMAICREIRSESPVPIVMLTARSGTGDVVAGLEAGADDYVAKPFKAKELIARIKTRLRHSPELIDHHIAAHRRPRDRPLRTHRQTQRQARFPSLGWSSTCSSPLPVDPSTPSADRCFSNRSGTSGPPSTPGSSTSRSSDSAPRSNETSSTPPSS